MGALVEGVLNQFRDRGMPDIGLTDIRADGKKRVFGPKKKAWYRLHEYHSPVSGKVWLNGVFGFKDEWWKVEHEAAAETMTPEERESARKHFERLEQQERERREKAARFAANRGRDQYQKASRTGESPYLVRKQVARAEAVRYMDNGMIIFPLIHYGRGEFVGSQKIAAQKDGSGNDKYTNKGMDAIGAACRLGDEPFDGDVILIGEGYATCATARQALDYGHPVFVALNAGNLMPVAKILRARYPASPLLFVADDDYLPTSKGAENFAGERKAAATVAAVGNAALVLPRFSVPRAAVRDDPDAPYLTDFNDLHCAEGIEPVRQQLAAAIEGLVRPVPAEASPAPTLGDDVAASAPPVATATHTGGAGVDADAERLAEMMAQQLYQHFALVDGKTRVIDKRFGTEYTLPSLRSRFGKKVVDAWLERPDKLLITQAEVSAAKKAKEEAEKKEDPVLVTTMERYVYLDGTTSIWDGHLQEMIPQGAAKLAMGSYFDVWVDSPERRVIKYSNVRFAPGMTLDEEHYINLFSGLELKPAYPAIKPLPRSIWELVPLFPACENIIALAFHLCDARNDVFEWLMNWLAYPLQHVGAKMDTAVLMHGSVHGSGKSMFFEKCMKPLYGRYSITLGQDQLDSQYTGSRSAKLFMLFEEVVGSKQRYSQTGKIKHMITGLTQVIEKKFMNAWEEANHGNCVFLSNAIQPVHVEAYDRRFQVIWPIEAADEAIYSEVDREVSSGGLEAFLGFLLALPLTLTVGREEPVKFDQHTKPLMTDEKKRLIQYGLSGWELFLFSWEHGEIESKDGEVVPFVSCIADELYRLYVKWCAESGETSVISANKFKIAASVNDQRKMSKARRWWRFKGGEAKQAQVFKVGREQSGVAEMDYLGQHISQFRFAARQYGVTLDD